MRKPIHYNTVIRDRDNDAIYVMCDDGSILYTVLDDAAEELYLDAAAARSAGQRQASAEDHVIIKSKSTTPTKPSRGHELILVGADRWQKYVLERRGKPATKSLTDFYAEAFDEELARVQK